MAKPEWGQKRTCPTCGARFYDMRRETIVCPVCEAVFDPERLPKARRSAAVREDKPVAAPARKAKPVEEDADATVLDDSDPDVELDGADDDDDDTDADTEEGDLIEDTSDLGEDDDDIGEVMEHVDDDDEKV